MIRTNKQGKLEMELRPISKLKPAEYNPRKKLQPGDPEYEDIKRSIETFGYADPIIINKDGTIIGGHQRLTVLRDLGYEEVSVIVVDLDKNHEKALNIALNKITGEWDQELLKELLEDLDLNGMDFETTGFKKNEIEELYISLEKDAQANDDDFDAEEAYEEIEEPRTKRGDVWILGRHRLMCGDCTVSEDVDRLMDGEEADLVITDPPYNVNYGDKAEFLDEYLEKGHRNTGRIRNDNMDSDSFYRFLLDAYRSMQRVMREGAAIYVFHAESTGKQFREAFEEAGLKLSQCLIWEKNTFVLGRQDYQWRHEPCLYGWKEGAAHYFIDDRTQDTVLLDDEVDLKAMTKSELIGYIEEITGKFKDQTTVFYENKPTRNDMHPTMKPIPLLGRMIKNSSKPKWKVADFFGGSGSTLMAAEQLDRSAYIMELDEKFCDVIVRRWEEYTGETAILETELLKGVTL